MSEPSPETMRQVEEMIFNIVRSMGPLFDPFDIHLQPSKANWGKWLILAEVCERFGGEAAVAASRLPLLTRH
jgi:hypothetical protein